MKIPNFLHENTLSDNKTISNRKEIVDNIYDFIKDNDKKQAIKIGLYGKWGTGKTTILRELENKIKKESTFWSFFSKITGRKTIFINVKYAESLRDVYLNFISDIKNSFSFTKGLIYIYIKILITIDIIAVIGSYFYNNVYLKADKGLFDILISKENIIGIIGLTILGIILKSVFSSNFIKGYIKNLDTFCITLYILFKKVSGKKVIIIVDDLDRLNPKFLPDILLWLNDISEIRKSLVNVIIAADPIKLSEGIKESNKHYEGNEGYEFLEKIVDTPYYIDNLNSESKYKFWNHYKDELIKDFEGFKYVENFIEYLPDNIRQIKRYFRFIYTYLPELKRYSDDEINYELLLFISLYKLEFPAECNSFVNKDIKSIKYGIMFTKKDDEEALKFKKSLDSEIKQKYFDYFTGKLFLLEELSDYYYFYDNIAKITNKELFENYIIGKNKYNDLIKLFKNDLISLLEILSSMKNDLYSKMIGKDFIQEMQKTESYVNKLYTFIDDTISHLNNELYIENKQLKSIISNLMSHDNFRGSGSGINYLLHREKEEELIKKIILKIHPIVLFENQYEIKNHYSTDMIDDLYWKYFLKSMDEEIYGYNLVKTEYQMFIYNRLLNKDGIDDIIKLSFTNKIQRNLQYLLYSFLELLVKNHTEDKEKGLKLIKSESFQNLLSKLNFSIMNHRSLGSLNNEVLQKLPNQFKEHLYEMIEKVGKYLVKK